MVHLEKFIEKIRAAEMRGQRDLSIPVRELKDIQTDLTKLLLRLQLYGINKEPETREGIVEINVSGGSYK